MYLPELLLLLIHVVYCLFTLALWVAWRSILTYSTAPAPVKLPFLSVVVAVRNEEENITSLLEDLVKQLYSKNFFEVIVIDDHSTDTTVRLVHSFQLKTNFSLRLLHLRDYLPASLLEGNYKKKAIEYGVSEARGEWIVLTDGDCRMGSSWLSSLTTTIAHSEAKMISGPVTFYGEQTFFEKMQTVEFASLIGAGAATLQWGVATMCNAANLAFDKSTFLAVNGYAGTADTPTGDDLFLMHKIHARYPGKVVFRKSPESIVYTQAKANWQAFYQQRKRWASKWNLYQDWRVTAVALFVFLTNASLLAGLLGYLFGAVHLPGLLGALLLRFGTEYVFLGDVLLFLRKKVALKWILPVQLVYFLYVTFFGIIAQKRGYVWKDRKLN